MGLVRVFGFSLDRFEVFLKIGENCIKKKKSNINSEVKKTVKLAQKDSFQKRVLVSGCPKIRNFPFLSVDPF